MNKPFISIVVGSDSDLSVVKDTAAALDQFGVPHELHILSAHNAVLPCVIISSFIAGAKYAINTIEQLPDFIQKTFAV